MCCDSFHTSILSYHLYFSNDSEVTMSQQKWTPFPHHCL